MRKNKLYNFLIILFLYIGISCFPFGLILKDNFWCSLLQIFVQIAFLIISFFVVKFKTDFDISFKKINIKYLLLLIPTIIVTASNFLYFAFAKEDIVFLYDQNFYLTVILNVFVVLNEEFIFRLIFINSLENKKNLRKILISAGVFGLCHLSVFLSSFNPVDLIVPVYTFALGLLLSLIYLKTNSIVTCVVFHLLFNLINSLLFSMFISNGIGNYWMYLLANIIVMLAVVIYLGLLIILKCISIDDKNIEEKC